MLKQLFLGREDVKGGGFSIVDLLYNNCYILAESV